MSDSFVDSVFSPPAETSAAPEAPTTPPAGDSQPFASPSGSAAAAAPAPEAQPFAQQHGQPPAQSEAPATPATPAAPAAPAVPEAPAPAPAIPAEYQTAHDFWTKTNEAARPLGGIEMVPNAVQWTSMLFGLGERPVDQATGQQIAPEVHFLNTLQQADPGIYSAFASELIERHKPAILNTYRNDLLQQLNIPADKLDAVQSWLKYGDQSVEGDAEREFLESLGDPALVEFYRKQPPGYRAHLVNSMPVDIAKETLADKKFIKDSQAQAEQAKEAEQQRQAEVQEAQTASIRESHIQKSEEAFIKAQAKELNLPEQQVGDWLQLVGLEMDREVNNLEAQLKQQYRGATPEQIKAEVYRRSDVARTWNQLTQACQSRNEMRIHAAMQQFRLLVETRFHNFLASRKTSAPAPAAPSAPAPTAPRTEHFPAPTPPASTGGSTGFVESLFGKGDPHSAF